MAGLPEGTLTFLLTDLVASTSAWEESPPAMRDAMAHHDRILAESLKLHRGIEVPSGRAGEVSSRTSRVCPTDSGERSCSGS